MKKRFLLISLSTASACMLAAGVMASLKLNNQFATKATGNGQWVHYSKRNASPSQLGIREYWVECGGTYQFTAPSSENITDKGSNYDTSGFVEFDDRYFTYKMDEHYHDLSVTTFGAGMYSVTESGDKTWRATLGDRSMHCNLYSNGGDKILWRIDLPRIDYTAFPTVTMDVTAPDWYNGNNMGPEADQLTYHTNFGGNKTEGKIKLTLGPSGLYMSFNSLEYASTLAFENTFTDSDIINGLKPAYFYTEDLYDRYLNIDNITLSTTASKVAVMHLDGDTSKVTVENGAATLPGSVDYSIINNGYGDNTNSLVIDGNANPGAMAVTMPAVNLNSYLASGVITFKFGVSNNNEPMYWGSGDGKVALGSNDPASQSHNNNGYVNWELTIMDGAAYVHNVYEDVNYMVSLTSGMLAGTEGIVVSGGGTSIYRRYLVTDFYWQLTPDYQLVAPNTPQDIYSYAGDTSKISVTNGTAAVPGTTDYSIIGNSYATANTGIEISGNANPGAMVATLPAFNLKPFAAVGKVTFKFGVRNNSESMYFGSGDGKVDLGKNSGTSQTDNNNGYVNWEMVITANGAYVHNVNTDQNIDVPLTAGMRAGTESIVISGGGTSVYRTYLVTDFYWSAL